MGDFKDCKLERCPYLKDVKDLLLKVSKMKIVYGSSPPSILVGSWGYPKVNLGPLLPPVIEDTSLMEKHELWLDIPLEKILSPTRRNVSIKVFIVFLRAQNRSSILRESRKY